MLKTNFRELSCLDKKTKEILTKASGSLTAKNTLTLALFEWQGTKSQHSQDERKTPVLCFLFFFLLHTH